MVRHALVLIMALGVASGCTFTGPKSGKPGWKLYKKDHDRPVPTMPLRIGAAELRMTRVVLRREYTVLKTSSWTASIRATVVSGTPLPWNAFTNTFQFVGESGRTYQGQVSTAGRAWDRSNPGQPFLPPGVPGELDIWMSFESTSDDVPDEVATLLVQGSAFPLR